MTAKDEDWDKGWDTDESTEYAIRWEISALRRDIATLVRHLIEQSNR